MRISLNSPVEIERDFTGYGGAGLNIYRSLKRLGHQVTLRDQTAPLQLNFMQPHLFQPNRFVTNILYFPWESTEMPSYWIDKCNDEGTDYLWTTTEWCRDIIVANGSERTPTVYHHGVTSNWAPRLRKPNGPVRYLIVDALANRKGWQEAFNAFRSVFHDDPRKATLTIKSRDRSLVRWFDDRNFVHDPAELPNVSINLKTLSEEEMVQLFYSHDVLIFPSWGEGFGLIPHQFLATGGITICTGEWAPYKNYLGDMAVKSTYTQSPWRGEHDGMMCKPDQEDLERLIKLSYDDFDNQNKKFYRQSFQYHEDYDWLKLTKEAFDPVVKNFE